MPAVAATPADVAAIVAKPFVEASKRTIAEAEPVPNVVTSAVAESVVNPRPENDETPSGGCGSSVTKEATAEVPSLCALFSPTTRAKYAVLVVNPFTESVCEPMPASESGTVRKISAKSRVVEIWIAAVTESAPAPMPVQEAMNVALV